MITLIAQTINEKITNPAVPVFGTGYAPSAFTNIIVTVWRTAVTLGGLALLVMLIMGALGWVTAGGDKGKIESARERITQSIVGMLVLVGTVAISLFISMMLHINLLQPAFENNLDTSTSTSYCDNDPCAPGYRCEDVNGGRCVPN